MRERGRERRENQEIHEQGKIETMRGDSEIQIEWIRFTEREINIAKRE